MKKEKDQEQPLSIQQIASLAKEVALRDGRHVPTLIAEGSRREVLIQFTKFGNTFEERQKQLTYTGYILAQDARLGLLRQAFFIGEGWMVGSEENKSPNVPPSQHPKRKEVLTVSGLTVASHQVGMVVYEMIRDDTGQLTELKTFASSSDESVSAQSPLLEALVLGYAMGSTRKDT